MKKIRMYIITILIFLLFFSCGKEYKEKKLEGKWYASISNPYANGYNEVSIEFKKNSVAYLNYSKDNMDKWVSPCECNWWIKKEKDIVYSTNTKQWFLYIVRHDVTCDACYDSSSSNLNFPDTSQYIIKDLKDDILHLELVRHGAGGLCYDYDLFFSESSCMWFCPAEKSFNR